MPVFSLKEAKELQVKNISQNTFKYWPESAVYGYYVGGYYPPSAAPFPPYPPSGLSLISRLDFSSETVSNPGKNLSTGRGYLAALSNISYGYFGGGYVTTYLGPPPVSYCTISRLDFSNETVSDPGKNLPTTINSLAATSSNSYGYFVAGAPLVSTIRRLDFSSETISLPGKDLPFARSGIGAVSNNSYGYFAGGFYTPIPSYYTCVISRLDFSSETTSDPGKNLSQIRTDCAATSSNSYGYFVGGYSPNPPSPGHLSTVTRLDFSSETTSDPGKNLIPTPIGSEQSYGLAATSNNSYSYFGGGGTPLLSAMCRILRLDFSNETVSYPGNNLSLERSYSAALTGGQSIYRGSKTYGYFGGGFITSIISRLDFSNETVSDPGKNLPTAIYFLAGTSSNSYGYFGGGFSPPYVNTISRLDFSNETVSNPGKNLPTARSNLAALSSSSYGYFGGGQSSNPTPPPTSINANTITRFDFSNETISDPGKNLPTVRYSSAAVSSSSYGYFGGGFTPPYINTISRLDFSNETVSDPGNNLPSGGGSSGRRSNLAAVSSNSYGYFGGGANPTFNSCTISRLDFSNETATDPGKNLSAPSIDIAAVSNNFYGYFGGIGPLSCTISRIDFSTENVSNPGKNLPTLRYSFAAVSNSN